MASIWATEVILFLVCLKSYMLTGLIPKEFHLSPIICSGAGICLYVDHLLNDSSEEVRKLRSYMYSFKAS